MINIRQFLRAIRLIPVSSTAIDSKGEIEVLDASGKLNYHSGASASPVVTEAHTATLTNKTIDADGTGNSITNIENADIKSGAAIDAAKIADGSVSNTEFQYLNSVTSDIQTQINNRLSGTLNSANIYVGNGSNVATGVALSGDATITNTGDLQIATGAIVNNDINASAAIERTKIASGSNDHVVINNASGVLSSEAQLALTRGGTGINAASVTALFNQLDPLTTKGDIIVHNGTDSIRVGVGSNNQVLTADSAEASGVKWAAAGSASGDAIKKDINQTAHGFSIGNVLRLNSSTYALANASADSTAEVIGIVSAVTDVNNFTITMAGFISGLSGLTAGTTYYLSTTAGAITATEPTAVNEVSKPVLVAASTTTGYVIQSRGKIAQSGSLALSEVYVDDGNGFGSTNTVIRRYSNTRKNVGSDITYADSATLGASFTINTTGIYSMTTRDVSSLFSVPTGISVNGTALTTAISTPITYAQGLRGYAHSAGANLIGGFSITLGLTAGDVVRVQTNGNAGVATNSDVSFSIVRVN